MGRTAKGSIEDNGRKFLPVYNLRPITQRNRQIIPVYVDYNEAQTRDEKRTDIIVDYLGEQLSLS